MIIHPGRNPRAPFEILDVLEQAGADISRTAMSHLDRTISNVDELLRLAERGCYLEFDLFGIEVSNYQVGEFFFLGEFLGNFSGEFFFLFRGIFSLFVGWSRTVKIKSAKLLALLHIIYLVCIGNKIPPL